MTLDELAIRYKIAFNRLEDALCVLEDATEDVAELRWALGVAEEALFRLEEDV